MKLKKGDIVMRRIPYGASIALDWDRGYFIVLEMRNEEALIYSLKKQRKETTKFAKLNWEADANGLVHLQGLVYKVDREHTEREEHGIVFPVVEETYVEVGADGVLTNNSYMIQEGKYQRI